MESFSKEKKTITIITNENKSHVQFHLRNRTESDLRRPRRYYIVVFEKLKKRPRSFFTESPRGSDEKLMTGKKKLIS